MVRRVGPEKGGGSDYEAIALGPGRCLWGWMSSVF